MTMAWAQIALQPTVFHSVPVASTDDGGLFNSIHGLTWRSLRPLVDEYNKLNLKLEDNA